MSTFYFVEDSGDWLLGLHTGTDPHPKLNRKDTDKNKDWLSLGRPLKFGASHPLPFKSEQEVRGYFAKNRETLRDLAERAGYTNPADPQ